MRTIVDAFAQYERALIRSRTKAALAAKKARGERTGNTPRGYAAQSDGQLVPDEQEQQVLARVRVLRAQGLTLEQLTAQLREEGVRSRMGKPLHRVTVAKIAAKVAPVGRGRGVRPKRTKRTNTG